MSSTSANGDSRALFPTLIGASPTANQLPFKINASDTDVYPPFHITRKSFDVALCSSDKIYFHGLKIFLAIASPLFRDMFTLPQPVPSPRITASDEIREGRPVIHVTESSATLKKLLVLCYPAWILNPPFSQLSDVQEVLEAATKYDMSGVIRCAGRALVTEIFLEQDPLRVFIIACRYRLALEASIAARHTLRIPIASRSYIPELEHITGGTLQRLIDYHFKCGSAAQGVATGGKYEWITCKDYIWFSIPGYHSIKCFGCNAGSQTVSIAGMPVVFARKYWLDYMIQVGNALAVASCVATVMRKDLLDSAIAMAKACTCPGPHATLAKTKVSEDFEAFRLLLAKEVERVLSLITFDAML